MPPEDAVEVGLVHTAKRKPYRPDMTATSTEHCWFLPAGTRAHRAAAQPGGVCLLLAERVDGVDGTGS